VIVPPAHLVWRCDFNDEKERYLKKAAQGPAGAYEFAAYDTGGGRGYLTGGGIGEEGGKRIHQEERKEKGGKGVQN